jgi:hypothetical protein
VDGLLIGAAVVRWDEHETKRAPVYCSHC